MSKKDSNNGTTEQFTRWLEREMSEQERIDFEQNIAEDELWHQRLETSRSVELQASLAEQQKVPNWDRGATFEQSKQPWWQWQGLSALSMAFSCFALALVVFKVEFVSTDQGMLISFAGSEQRANQVAQIVDQKLKDFQHQQQLSLANFSAELNSKQQQNSMQLASYILDTSRQERKEDISDFILYFNQQRKDDLLEQRIKYNQLEDALNYQTQFLTTNQTNLQPANWVVEE